MRDGMLYDVIKKIINLKRLVGQKLKALCDEGLIVKVKTYDGKFEYQLTEYGRRVVFGPM